MHACINAWIPTCLTRLMVVSFNYAFAAGHLSVSQSRVLSDSFSKKEEDLLYLKNWGSVSLLNFDYELATKSASFETEKRFSPKLLAAHKLGMSVGFFLVVHKYPFMLIHNSFTRKVQKSVWKR